MRGRTKPLGLLYTLAISLVSAGLIHVGTTLAIPMLEAPAGYERLAASATVNRMTVLPPAAPGREPLALNDPDQRLAICRYDLTNGPIAIQAVLADRGWSLGLYTLHGANYYVVSGVGLQQPVVTLTLEPPKERSFNILSFGKPAPAQDPSRIAAPGREGLIVIRAASRGRAYRAQVEELLAQAKCAPAPR